VLLVLLGLARVVSAGVVVERVGIEVMPTDPKGKAWDRDSRHAAPDPQIEVRFADKKVIRCKTVDDVLTAECVVPEHDPAAVIELSLRVADADHGIDEEIGTARITIASGHEGRVDLAVTGRLARAWADVRSTRDSLLTPVVACAAAAGLGCALVLLLYVVLRRRFLSPIVDDDVSPFRRSPVLLAGAASAAAGILVAFTVRDVQPLVGAIPVALGTFSVTGAVLDAIAHRRLRDAHVRLVLFGLTSAFIAPGLSGLTYLWSIGLVAIAAVVIVLLGWLT
jgi:hypothetical protein